jgi:hypothetical protein
VAIVALSFPKAHLRGELRLHSASPTVRTTAEKPEVPDGERKTVTVVNNQSY